VKKKALTTAVGLAVIATLAGCSTTSVAASTPIASKSQAPVTIEFWNNFTGTGPLGTELGQLVDQFNTSHPGITVKPVYQPYDTMLQTLQTAVAAGQPPAVAQLELTNSAQLEADGALTPVPSLLSKSDAASLKKSVIPAIEDANSYKGTVYTVPFGYNSNVLYYNKDLVQKAGIDPSQLPTTWTQLEKDATKLTQDTNNDGTPDVYGYAFPAQAPWILEVRLWQEGADLFNSGNTKALFDSAKGVDAFSQYQDLLKTNSAEMVQTDSSLTQLTQLFAAGKVAMFEQSSTAAQSIESTAKFDVGVAQFPTLGKKVYSLGGYNLGVFKGAPKAQQQAAAVFAKWWATPAVAAKWTSISNYMPGIQAAWDTSTLKKWEAADPRRAVAAKQMAGTRPRPNFPSYPQIATDLANAFQATMSGQGSAKSNLTTAANQANSIIAGSN
jgi:ABC-type glycerol-3-phosphate transport system substrate-binding protein